MGLSFKSGQAIPVIFSFSIILIFSVPKKGIFFGQKLEELHNWSGTKNRIFDFFRFLFFVLLCG